MSLLEFMALVDEDIQGFVNKLYKILAIMGVSPKEKVELFAYKSKVCSRIQYEQWMDERARKARLVLWKELKGAFLDWFFPLELWEEKIQEFINQWQGGISVREYSLEFSKLSKYAFLWYPT